MAFDYKAGTFNLYNEAGFEPGTGCDVGTSLTLDKGEVIGKIAVLTNFVDGECELYVAPNKRSYMNLKEDDYGCGSKVYTGSRLTEDFAKVEVEIVDHRTRYCRDIIDARIIVTESNEKNKKTLYSTMFKR